MADLFLHAPRSLAEATALLAQYGGEARPIAGGTALVLMPAGSDPAPASVRAKLAAGYSPEQILGR